MCLSGRGVPQDDNEAVRWHQRSVEHGEATGQNNLGYMFAEGRGVPQNDAEAVKWYRRAGRGGGADQSRVHVR